MFTPEELNEIARLNRVADEITTRTDIEQPDDEGDQNFEEHQPAKVNEKGKDKDGDEDDAYDS